MLELKLGEPLSAHLYLVLQAFHLIELCLFKQLSSLFNVIDRQVALVITQVIDYVLKNAAITVYKNQPLFVNVEIDMFAPVNNFS